VLFLYSPLDDFVMTNNLLEYKDKKIASAEASQVSLNKEPQEEKLTADEVNSLIKWMKTALESKVSSIKVCILIRKEFISSLLGYIKTCRKPSYYCWS
jgi:HSP90 family molecular chaperone